MELVSRLRLARKVLATTRVNLCSRARGRSLSSGGLQGKAGHGCVHVGLGPEHGAGHLEQVLGLAEVADQHVHGAPGLLPRPAVGQPHGRPMLQSQPWLEVQSRLAAVASYPGPVHAWQLLCSEMGLAAVGDWGELDGQGS